MQKVSESDYSTYHNHRVEPYFTFIKTGQKTIEGRIRKGYYCFIKPGDHIIIYNEEETKNVEVLVKRVRSYRSFREMLANEPLKRILPDVETIEEGLKVYREFYTRDQEKKFGVVAIGVERLRKA